VTCPQGETSTWWSPASQRGTDVIVVQYAAGTCQPCPVKTSCTTATRTGRQLTLRPQPVQQALDTARAEQTTTAWQTRYARRAGTGPGEENEPAGNPAEHEVDQAGRHK
jgi:hypothetical protein